MPWAVDLTNATRCFVRPCSRAHHGEARVPPDDRAPAWPARRSDENDGLSGSGNIVTQMAKLSHRGWP